MHESGTTVKRLVALLLLAAMFLLIGCEGDKPKPPADTTVSGETTAPADDTTADDASYASIDLPEDLDFGGEQVRILCRSDIWKDSNDQEHDTVQKGELLVEDLNNDVVNDAIYNRQIWVEDLLGIELSRFEPSGDLDISDYLDRMLTAGDQDCEIVASSPMDCVAAAIKGYNMNMSDVSYIDLDSPWWFQTFSDRATIADGLFFVDGDLSLTTLKQSYVVAYNKNFAEARGIDNLYDIVFDGLWTLDKMIETASGMYLDMNGNSEVDEEDQFGIVAGYCFADSYWVSFNIPVFTKDEDGHLAFTLNQEKYGTAFEKTMRLQKSIDADMHAEEPLKVFTSGNSLFYGMELGDTESHEMRNMQDVYGIIPVPKYDESQPGYYTMPHDTHTAFMIPMNVKNEELAGAALDALNWYSYRYVTPAYLDVALKGQYANDPETRRILDIVTDGISFESAWIFAFQLNEMAQCWRYLLCDEDDGYAQNLAKKERAIKILIRELNDNYDKLCE